MHKRDARELSPLPLGTASFSALREAGEIYADKTALVRDLGAHWMPAGPENLLQAAPSLRPAGLRGILFIRNLPGREACALLSQKQPAQARTAR